MVQTDNEFQMLMSRLDRLDAGQNAIQADIQKLHSNDAGIRERIAKLETMQSRYITWKYLLIGAGSSISAGGVLGHLITRVAG